VDIDKGRAGRTTRRNRVSRRDLIRTGGGLSGALAVGIFAFPLAAQVVEAVGASGQRVTRTYERVRVAALSRLAEGEPFDFKYPLQEHDSFLVKQDEAAEGGTGSSWVRAGWRGPESRSSRAP
jgi:hypothetical protein